MSSAPTDCRVPDPTDAKADGAFGGTHRAGYGTDRLDRIIATARKGWTLVAVEGLVLVQEIDRLRGELELVSSEAAEAFNDRDAIEGMYRHHVAVALDAIAKLNHAQAVLAKLREPSLEIRDAVIRVLNNRLVTDTRLGEDVDEIIEAAVAAAEREVSNYAR